MGLSAVIVGGLCMLVVVGVFVGVWCVWVGGQGQRSQSGVVAS